MKEDETLLVSSEKHRKLNYIYLDINNNMFKIQFS